jgi:hypothetical protein
MSGEVVEFETGREKMGEEEREWEGRGRWRNYVIIGEKM